MEDVLDRLLRRIQALTTDCARVLVGIDGPDAAGKTTLADRLAGRLDVFTVRASVDGFHRPRAVRYRRGALSPEGCYLDTFDHETLVGQLLEPFARGAGEVRTRSFDHVADAPVEVTHAVAARAVLVVDGVFLLRPALRGHWTLAVHLHVPPLETLRRARIRDVGELGSAADVEQRYLQRYLPAQALYRADAEPLASADVVLDNSDPQAPVVLRW